MSTHALPIPGLVLGSYPERRTESRASAEPSLLDRLRAYLPPQDASKRFRSCLEQYRSFAERMHTLASDAVPEAIASLRARLRHEGFDERLLAEALALTARVCRDTLGFELFDAQILAARTLLDRRLAEMATGEGKTVVAGVAAGIAALAGIPVHVVTANDYLVSRDAAILEPFYSALRLRVAAVTAPLDREARCRAYKCDVVYSTASELVFDYLRDSQVRVSRETELQRRVTTLDDVPDRRAPPQTVLRGLCMAIVDEADSVLIDDARVPLILSERRDQGRELPALRAALTLAERLSCGEHFVLDRSRMRATLTTEGRTAAEALSLMAAGHRLQHEERLETALSAVHLYARDRDYLVRDGAVHIIDASTGRIAQGRVWSRGLHALIELKEGCEPSIAARTVTQITYQRFFGRYLALAGMSGTLREAQRELMGVYGLAVVRIPLARPSQRRVMPTRLFRSREAAWEAAVNEAIAVSGAGRPVLIGTDSVSESEAISQRLSARGIAHTPLNAKHDGDEARIIAAAGESGRITVATNMAGRGTDIALADGVSECGGLHVISCQHNASQRIDRQLMGRCARRGDRGSARALIALEKPLIARALPATLVKSLPLNLERPQWLVRAIVRLPQWLEENRQRAQRRALLVRDRRMARSFAFGGAAE